MAETRSALARRAARSACAGSAGTTSFSQSHLASAATRSTLSASEPNFSWNTMSFTLGRNASSPPARTVARSCSQKKRASDRRAESTRWLPWVMAAPPSVASRLATQMKAGTSAPLASASAKYFWLVRMVSTITSHGTDRKSGSKRPSSGTGHSVRPAFSATRPSSGISDRPAPAASSAARVAMIRRRSALEASTCAARS